MTNSLNSDKKLRVLQVLPSLVSGGVERGTLDLCKYLIEQGHEAWVISSGGPLVKPLEDIGARHITLSVHSKNPFKIWRNSQILKQLIQSHQFDLKGDACIAVSQFIASHINTVYPQHHTNIKLIHRGIDLTTFTQSQSNKDKALSLRQKWHIAEHDKIIILPGRLTRLKGHPTFLEAIARLTEHTSVHCLIVGDEPGKDHYQQELQAFIIKHKLSNRVQFTGNYYDMPAMYQLADIVISASIKPESFGRTACEAQAMGCLVIATKHGGSLETISPLQQQFMCKVKDSESMSSAIKKALFYCDKKNLQERAKIEDASRIFIEQNFSLNKMCNDTIALYREVMSKNTGQL